MIKIKDYIFNENSVMQIDKCCGGLTIQVENGSIYIDDATFDDIEWNYGTPQETQRQMQKELCKSCYYRDTISNKLKELEEKYDKALTDLAHESHKRIELEEKNKRLNFCMQDTYDSANDICSELQQKINKTTKFTEKLYKMTKEQDSDNVNLIDRLEIILKTLKGE